MESPTFADMLLCRSDGSVCCGAAFELQEAARESETVVVEGWEAEVREGRRVVVIRGGIDESYDDAFRSGIAHGQKALDIMSIRGGNNLVIKTFEDDHLTWWLDSGRLVIRIVSFTPVRIDVPPVTVTVTDADGNVVPPVPTPPLAWHESLRYFRLSQTTDDLFDAYRSAYLALESVLSSIAPQRTDAAGKVNEGESAWFKRALAEADKVVPLASVVPQGIADPVQHLFDELYVDMRSAMSHAKSGRKILLPQDEAERNNVTESLRRLVGLYLKLAEAHLGTRRLGGGMFAIAFRMMMAPTLERMTTYVSDDESPLDKSDISPNPAGGMLEELPPMGPADTSASFVAARVWSAPLADLGGIPFVRRVVGMVDEHPGITAVLEARLTLGSAYRLEVMLGARGSNTRQPRERYSF